MTCSLLPKPLKLGFGEPDEILDVFNIEARYYDDAAGEEKDNDPVRMAAAVVVRIPRGSYEVLREACDAYSGDLLDAFENCYSEDGSPLLPLSEPVWVLDRFVIEPGFERAAELFLDWIIDNVCRWNGSLVVYPVRKITEGSEWTVDNSTEATACIREFYASQGFLPLRDTAYMFLNMD